MKRKLLTGLLLVGSMALCFAAAIDISGKWKASLKMDDGSEYPLTYNFKVDGAKLTGNVQTQTDDLPINDGVLKGDSIRFTVNYNGSVIPNAGKCYADSIVLNTTLSDAVYHVVLTRGK